MSRPAPPNLETAPGRHGGDVWLSGPELHTVGTPRRRRRVWCVRLGVVRGVAQGGFVWKKTEPEARAVFNRHAADS